MSHKMSYIISNITFKRESKIKDGPKSPNINGSVTFDNIHFGYPTRIDVQVLKGKFKISVKMSYKLIVNL